MSSVPYEEINLPKEACPLSITMSIYNMYICKNILIAGPVSGSAEQPLLAPNERALSQPKPHLSNRTV